MSLSRIASSCCSTIARTQSQRFRFRLQTPNAGLSRAGAERATSTTARPPRRPLVVLGLYRAAPAMKARRCVVGRRVAPAVAGRSRHVRPRLCGAQDPAARRRAEVGALRYGPGVAEGVGSDWLVKSRPGGRDATLRPAACRSSRSPWVPQDWTATRSARTRGRHVGPHTSAGRGSGPGGEWRRSRV